MQDWMDQNPEAMRYLKELNYDMRKDVDLLYLQRSNTEEELEKFYQKYRSAFKKFKQGPLIKGDFIRKFKLIQRELREERKTP